jgi:flagellar biosynthesis activator protein FlaF
MTFPAKGYQRTPEPGNPARSEAWALLEAARQLNKTKEGPIDDFRAALRANWRLWTLFQANLVDADCKLPDQLRGNLLGLANFIDKTTVALLVERDPKNIETLVNINRQISEGLLDGVRAKRAEDSPQAPDANAPPSVRQTA